MKKAGRPVDPADRPPGLEWEEPVWTLFVRTSTQWRHSFGGRAGMDFGPALALAGARGWDLDRTLILLGAIEETWLEIDGDERAQRRQG